MPEGHTLRRLADDLVAAFAGRAVRVSSPQGRFAAEAAELDGTTLLGADAAGKHLFVELDHERFVHVHLGLIGSFDVHAGVDEVPEPVGAVRLRLVAATTSGRRTPTCAARSCATSSARAGGTRSWAGSGPTRCGATPTPTWRGAGSRAAPGRSATC